MSCFDSCRQACRPFLPSTDLKIFSGRCRRSPTKLCNCSACVCLSWSTPTRSIGPVAFSASAMIERSTFNPATVQSLLPGPLVKTPQGASALCLRCQILGLCLSPSILSTTELQLSSGPKLAMYLDHSFSFFLLFTFSSSFVSSHLQPLNGLSQNSSVSSPGLYIYI